AAICAEDGHLDAGCARFGFASPWICSARPVHGVRSKLSQLSMPAYNAGNVTKAPRMATGKILVVDDEANARTALAEILKDEGYSVESAADGFKALPKLRDCSPNVVLTDLKMPDMDGLELIGKVRELDPEIGVVIMTAFGAVDTAV